MRSTLVLFSLAVPAFLAQSATQAPPLTLEQKEEFLVKATVKVTHPAKKGITGTVRATLSDGTITHDASIQRIDEEKTKFEGSRGTELNFRDTYKFNIAAYRLGKLLGLASRIPPSVERSFEGVKAAWTWWVEDIQGDEVDRMKKKMSAPDKDAWSSQFQIMQVFDQLIFNTDGNATNILYDKDWRLWMIDHTRAFRMSTSLMTPKSLTKCDRSLLAKIKELQEETVKKELGPWLKPMEIKGLLARRDKIVAFFEKGGDARLYDYLPPQ
jgi:hypothetical protein